MLNVVSEDQFTRDVLIPLLLQCGFTRINLAGHKDKALEYGKDIWMKFQASHVLDGDPPITPDYESNSKQTLATILIYPGTPRTTTVHLSGDETVRLYDSFHDKDASRAYLLLFGRIIYTDIFGNQHTTGWSRTWYGEQVVQGMAPDAYDYAD